MRLPTCHVHIPFHFLCYSLLHWHSSESLSKAAMHSRSRLALDRRNHIAKIIELPSTSPVRILSAASVLARGPPIISQHGNNTVISFCYTLGSESNRERRGDKQQEGDKDGGKKCCRTGRREEGEGERRRERREHNRMVFFTVKLQDSFNS